MQRVIVGAVLIAALTGCLQDAPLGPDLGACADTPDRAFTFGEAGIGTCIAGPVDLRFVQIDGSPKLLVSNADPYQNYTSGSLLVIDWDALDLDNAPARLPMDRVPASAAILDDDRYLGQIGLVLDRDDGTPLALVPSRFSRDATTADVDDRVHVVDLSDPSAPVRWAEGPELVTGADPMHVAVTEGRAYVSHLSENYLAVIDTHATPLAFATLTGGARISSPTFSDADDSGSNASLAVTTILQPSLMLREPWTLTWADANWRIWAPGEAGLLRWDLGGGLLVPSPTNPEIPSSTFDEPVSAAFAVLGEGQQADLWLASGGSFFLATRSGTSTDWSVDVSNSAGLPRGRTGNTPEALDAPSVFAVGDQARVAFDARLDDAPASIGVASQLLDGAWAVDTTEALVPPVGASFEDPMVRIDPFWGTPRMWLSERAADGDWRILESVSGDGLTWAEPRAVTGLPEGAASPVVNWFNGRYLAWFVVWDDADGWSLARATSLDGLDWTDVEVLQVLPRGDDPDVPPRPAVLTSVLGGFRVEGADTGRLDGLALDGQFYEPTITARGFTFEVSTGFVAEAADLDDSIDSGSLAPGAVLSTADGDFLLLTLTDATERPRIVQVPFDEGALDLDAATTLYGPDVDGLVDATDPVVYLDGSTPTLLFAETDEILGSRIRRATLGDGGWTLSEEPVLTSAQVDADGVDYASDALLPGAVQDLGDGRLRLWFTGVINETSRIGTAISEDGGQTFTHEPGPTTAWRFAGGPPGAFDDAGVRDPTLFSFRDETWLAYSGLDGSTWRLGLARLQDADSVAPTLVRRTDLSGASGPWLPLLARTFAAGGHEDPVVRVVEDELEVWFAGDGLDEDDPQRLGVAFGTPEVLYPDLRMPTRGDILSFTTINAGGDEGQLVLDQSLDGFNTTSVGLSGLRHDPSRGVLYVTSGASNGIIAVDTERSRDRIDGNVDDIEGVLRVRASGNSIGFRDVIAPVDSDLLYASSRAPDTISVIDASPLVDDSTKEAYDNVLLGTLSMRTANRDVGAPGDSEISAATMALRERDGHRHLFVPHFRDNSLSVFDLDRGDFGEQVGYVPFIGENPHVVRLSPDGRYAVVASFLGDVEEGQVSSTLTVVDADPDSPTFLDVVTTLVNR